MKSYREKYPEDVKRMERIVEEYELELPVGCDVVTLWLEHSYSLAAGWLGLPKIDEQLLRILKIEIEREESRMFDFND